MAKWTKEDFLPSRVTLSSNVPLEGLTLQLSPLPSGFPVEKGFENAEKHETGKSFTSKLLLHPDGLEGTGSGCGQWQVKVTWQDWRQAARSEAEDVATGPSKGESQV